MSTRDRYALEGLSSNFGGGREYYRAICEVCDRRGHSGFMGYLVFDSRASEGRPRPKGPDPYDLALLNEISHPRVDWVWHIAAKRLNKSEAQNPLRGWESIRFGRVSITDSWTADDVPLKPRCNAERPHQLKVMDSADILNLVETARTRSQDWIVIPE